MFAISLFASIIIGALAISATVGYVKESNCFKQTISIVQLILPIVTALSAIIIMILAVNGKIEINGYGAGWTTFVLIAFAIIYHIIEDYRKKTYSLSIFSIYCNIVAISGILIAVACA